MNQALLQPLAVTELERHLEATGADTLGKLTDAQYGEALALCFCEKYTHEPDYRWVDMGSFTEAELGGCREIAQTIALEKSKGNHNKATQALAMLGQYVYDAMASVAVIEIDEQIHRVKERRATERFMQGGAA